ncbi:MAG: protein tyrosine phosphatase [Sandaracinus sp.]|nr:protein tyrosine phosphatase [Sandaracinus sp.]
MSGFVDLHAHWVPAVDDGVKTDAEALEMLRGLAALGYARCVATPHIRTAMFENRRPGLEDAHAAFVGRVQGEALPELGLGAEHFFDDVFWGLFQRGEHLPYPGGKAALVELPPERLPLRLEHVFFEMRVRGVRPILAHPERYRDFYDRSDALEPLLDAGAVPQLDLMSLVGRYGRHPQRAAERLLDEGFYYLACSDAHRPADVELVGRGIERLRELVGREEADAMLGDHPRRVLAGDPDFE